MADTPPTLRIARILNEDDAFLTLEVVKDEGRELRIEDGDRFLTLIFVHNTGDGAATPWVPWAETGSSG